jgi:hypothetical protein
MFRKVYLADYVCAYFDKVTVSATFFLYVGAALRCER